jgi:ArsR family transcriptional regulator, arsenate/arsenite/antimonite-responsive transcriptional repressor
MQMNLQAMAGFYRALGEPQRLRIVKHLLDKECICICELAALLGKDQSVVFRHVMTLERAGILCARKEGKYLICCVKDRRKLGRLLEV